IEDAERYEVSIVNKNHGNMMITKDYEPEAIDIPVTKVWDDADNQDGVRPDNVRVNLLADGEIERTAEIEADENGEWSHTFTDLPVNDNGVEINYTVTENTVEYYSTSFQYTGEEFTVTNSHTPGHTSANVTIASDDANNK